MRIFAQYEFICIIIRTSKPTKSIFALEHVIKSSPLISWSPCSPPDTLLSPHSWNPFSPLTDHVDPIPPTHWSHETHSLSPLHGCNDTMWPQEILSQQCWWSWLIYIRIFTATAGMAYVGFWVYWYELAGQWAVQCTHIHIRRSAAVCSGSVVVNAYDSESSRPGSNPDWGLIYHEAPISAQLTRAFIPLG